MTLDSLLDGPVGRWPDWKDANCVGLPTAEADRIFFPRNGKVGPEARALCDPCQMRRTCAVMSTGETDGVWAGVNLSTRKHRETAHPAA